MHRLSSPLSPTTSATLRGFATLLVVLAAGCAKPQRTKIDMVPIGTSAVPVTNEGGNTAANQGPHNECLTSQIDDLDSILRRGECDAELPSGYSLDDQLQIKVAPTAFTVAPGETADIRVVMENVSKTKLAVYLYRDPEASFAFKAIDAKGVDQRFPADGFLAPHGTVTRIVLTPGGRINTTARFDAVRFKWKGKRDRQLVSAGNLRKGDYAVSLYMPLAGKVSPSLQKTELTVSVK